MKLNEMIALTAIVFLGLTAAPRFSTAQQAASTARIGLILNSAFSPRATASTAGNGIPAQATPALEAFRQGLCELGYVEGENLALEVRYGAGQVERLPGLAAELVKFEMNVIAMTSANTPSLMD
ncbi:hypothetical protein [Polaromonas jejuensis]|uniref:ABC transporter substrate-binding protein n=1 Tax=Polaromonas jejuensis TaxID=457502 RepID=A0ABW0Q6K4_9BURK|nr:hypothetical protein [Polaromonas jejuensis]